MARFKPNGSFQLGEHNLQWAVRHYGGCSSLYSKMRGLSVAVWAVKENGRELHIEFGFADYFFDKPKKGSDFEKRLTSCVSRALGSQWNPSSRGKPLKIAAADLEEGAEG